MDNRHGLAIRNVVVSMMVAALGFVAGPAQSATLTQYGDLTSFSAAAGGSLQTQDFSGYAAGTGLSGVEFLPGISATANLQYLEVFGTTTTDQIMFGFGAGRAGGLAMYDITLAQSYNHIAFDITSFEADSTDSSTAQGPGTLTVFFADASSQVLSIFGNPTGADIFIGLGSDTAISRITWAEALEGSGGNEETALDNFRVAAIPEPEIYAMMGIGLGLLGWVGRRRKQQAA